MKTQYLLLLTLSACLIVSCQEQKEACATSAWTLSFQASNGDVIDTRTVLQENGSVYWSPGDAINVFSDSSSGIFVSENMGTVAQTTFKGTLDGLDPNARNTFWATYPYRDDNQFDGSSLTLFLPDEQTAVAGSFDNNLFLSMARSDDHSLHFFNVCGGVKFSLTQDGIKSVVFKGNGHEVLAGRVKAGFDARERPEVQQVLEGKQEIRLTAPEEGTFETGKWYYIVCYPVTLNKGYTLSFYGESPVGERSDDHEVSIKRSIWGVLADADAVEEFFELDASSASVPAEGGQVQITVTSNIGYYVSSLPDWIQEGSVTQQGTNMKTHNFTVGANPDASPRSGVIVFCNDHGVCVPFNVSQEAASAPSLEVNPSSLSYSADAGTRTFSITSNQSWTVTSNQSWCQVSPAAGSNNGTITVTASANSASDARNATITVAVPGTSLSKTITVTQSGSGSQDSFDWSQVFYHRSLVMRFTATWCGWCPRMAKTVKLAMEQNPGKIEPLYLHGGGSDLEFSGTNALMNQYSITGFPTGIVDGRRLVSNGDISSTASLIGQYLKETEDNYPVSSAISYESFWSGQNLSVDVALYLRYAAKYKVTVVLLEDGIVNAQSDYEDGNHSAYVHDHIARMALSNIYGDAFTISQNQTVKHFNYSVTVPSSYNKSNLRILVYVQREFGTQTVLQTSSSYGSYYVDNCASGAAGGSLAPTIAGQASGGNEGIGNGGDINM